MNGPAHASERFSRYVPEFTNLYVRVVLSNHLLRIIEMSGNNYISERSNEDLAHPTAASVGCEMVVLRMIDIDFCGS